MSHHSLPPVYLSGAGLLSKWGFSDGDLMLDWAWDNLPLEDAERVAPHELLIEVVAEYLLPQLTEWDVQVEDISTNHNPIRARSIDGVEVDQYNAWRHPISNIEVAVPGHVVLRKIRVSQSESDTDTH